MQTIITKMTRMQINNSSHYYFKTIDRKSNSCIICTITMLECSNTCRHPGRFFTTTTKKAFVVDSVEEFDQDLCGLLGRDDRYHREEDFPTPLARLGSLPGPNPQTASHSLLYWFVLTLRLQNWSLTPQFGTGIGVSQ